MRPTITVALLLGTLSTAVTQQTDCANVTATKVRQIITWEPFFITGGPTPRRPVTTPYPLTISERLSSTGFVYRPRDNLDKFWNSNILFTNENKWEIVNCTYSYGTVQPAPLQREACGVDQIALHLPTPDTSEVDKVGKIGTLAPITYPKLSPWAVYDLYGFRITPDTSYNDTAGKRLIVEVDGWNDQGKKVGKYRQKIIGGKSGYNISIPDGGWQRILQWQVRLRPQRGSGGYGYFLDDLDVNKYQYDPTCVSLQALEYGPTPRTQKLSFKDLPTGPLQSPYHGFNFSANWQISQPPNASASTGGLALYAAPNPDVSNTIAGASATLWDIRTLTVTVDPTIIDITLPHTTIDPANFLIVVNGARICYTSSQLRTARPSRYLAFTSWKHTVDIEATIDTGTSGLNYGLFDRMFEVGVSVRFYPNPEDLSTWENVGFWLEGMTYRLWSREGRDGKARFRQGCYRCLKYLTSMCEWPAINRPLPPRPDLD